MSVLANKLGLEGEGFVGMGWLRELPDFRDCTFQSPAVKEMLGKLGIKADGMAAGMFGVKELRGSEGQGLQIYPIASLN